MKRLLRRLRNIIIILFLLLLVASIGLLVLHLRSGGDLESLRERADGWLREGRETAGRLADQAREFTAPEETTGEIAVFFAPAAALRPWGIDDHLLRLINRAEDRIDCAFYEFQLMPVAEALVAQHDAGVAVRIVSDSHYEKREAVQACIAAGIPVVFDKRSPFMHNKFCVVDGRFVWTGSTNITENGMYRNNNNAVLLQSRHLAENYRLEFLEMFETKKFGGRSPARTPYPEVTVAGMAIECYFAPEDNVEEEVIAEVQAANSEILFMAFSFTSKKVAEAMAARMKRGVRVRGVFEARGAGGEYARDDYLRNRGADVRTDSNPYTMHHKVIVIDGSTVITGSYNFSKSANTKNDENVLVIHDAKIAEQYQEEFARLVP